MGINGDQGNSMNVSDSNDFNENHGINDRPATTPQERPADGCLTCGFIRTRENVLDRFLITAKLRWRHLTIACYAFSSVSVHAGYLICYVFIIYIYIFIYIHIYIYIYIFMFLFLFLFLFDL